MPSQYITGIDAWELRAKLHSALCITTNGYTVNGRAIMGRGIALQARDRFPGIDFELGRLIQQNGNIVQVLSKKEALIAFPVKPISKTIASLDEVVQHQRPKYKVGQSVPGFALVADLGLIQKSCVELMLLIDKYRLDKMILPYPGRGAGELNPDRVKPILDQFLDNRVVVISRYS